MLTKSEYQLLRQLTHFSKNFYNQTLFTLRQYYFAHGSVLPYEQAYYLLKDAKNYQKLPSQVVQQTMRLAHRVMRSFFGLLWVRQNGTYTYNLIPPDPNAPLFAKRRVFCLYLSEGPVQSRRKNCSPLPGGYFAQELGVRYLYYKFPQHIQGKNIKEICLSPRFHGRFFEIEYIYVVDPETPELDPS